MKDKKEKKKEIKYKIITEKELDELIENKIKSNEKRSYIKELILPGIIIVIVSVALSTVIDIELQRYSSEKYANLDSNAWIENDSIILDIHNYANSHSAKNIRIYGNSYSGEGIVVDYILDQMLIPNGNLIRKIPVEVISKVTPWLVMSDLNKTEDIDGRYTASMDFNSSIFQLYYRIECDGCDNKLMWNSVKIPKKYNEIYSFVSGCGDNMSSQLSYNDYRWKEYGRDIPVKFYFD